MYREDVDAASHFPLVKSQNSAAKTIFLIRETFAHS